MAGQPQGGPVRGLHHLVVEELGRRIAGGSYATGEQIFPDAVAEEFQASRPVVREALRVLQAKGMVRPRPKVGTRVLPLPEWNVLDSDVIAWRLAGPGRSEQLRELTELRIAIELFAARLAAGDPVEGGVHDLSTACDAMERAVSANDRGAFTVADISFHGALLDASGNPLFRTFQVPFATYLEARVELGTLPSVLDLGVVEAHRDVVRAIESNDTHAAEQAARAIVERAASEIQAHLAY